MPRARMIKPEFYDDEKLASVSRDARLLFTGLWVQSDDYAVVKGNHRWLMAKIFPYDDIDLKQFSKWMKELESIDCIRHFQANGENYYWIRTFSDHQTINKPSQTRNPTPPDTLLNQCSSGVVALPSETEVVKQKSKTEIESTSPSKPMGTRMKKSFDPSFDMFWLAYPKKVAKPDAQKAWLKAMKLPDFCIDKILEALEMQKNSSKWKENGGEFIPYPASWLNKQRWLDESQMEADPWKELH